MLLEAGKNIGWTWDVVLSSYCVAHKLVPCLCKAAVLICLVKILSLRNLPCEVTLPHFSVSEIKGYPSPSVSERRAASPQAGMHDEWQFRQGSLGAPPSQGNSALAYLLMPEMLRTDTQLQLWEMLSPWGIWERISGTRVQFSGSSLKLSRQELSLGPPWSLKVKAKCEA